MVFKEGEKMLKINLKDHKSSQCHVEVEKHHNVCDNTDRINLWFVSYVTGVIHAYEEPAEAEIPRGFRIECTGTYSPTTRKQIGWFLKEYFPQLNYFDMKEIVPCGDFITSEMDKSTYNRLKEMLED